MNVLFDDGISFDRRLRYEDKPPNINIDYWGRCDKYSEAFSFFQPIDNIWGDFYSRDLEEMKFSGDDGNPNTRKQKSVQDKKVKFKEKYYLKRLLREDDFPIDSDIKNWKNYIGDIIDIASLFPIDTEIFKNEFVLGVGFDIYRKETFKDEKKKWYNIFDRIRHKVVTYFLGVKLVVNDGFNPNNYPFLMKNKIDIFMLSKKVEIKTSSREDLTNPNNDIENLFKMSPTLVLNKNTILENRNYNGEWKKNPKNWDEQNQGEFNAELYWEGPNSIKGKMVVRIGRINERYYLFLHGDHESGCPIRIPTD